MFEFLKNIFTKPVIERQYTFVWYMKFTVGDVYISKKYPAIVNAYTLEDAKKKVAEFAHSKMQLIIEEGNFSTTKNS